MLDLLRRQKKVLVTGLDCGAPQLVFDAWRDRLPNLPIGGPWCHPPTRDGRVMSEASREFSLRWQWLGSVICYGGWPGWWPKPLRLSWAGRNGVAATMPWPRLATTRNVRMQHSANCSTRSPRQGSSPTQKGWF